MVDQQVQDAPPEAKKTHRGTSNTNDRGSAENRRRRKAWLLTEFAADTSIVRVEWEPGVFDYVALTIPLEVLLEVAVSAEKVPTARCYRCPRLLHFGTITVDRVRPGCRGGRYVRANIRPACARCNFSVGATLRSEA